MIKVGLPAFFINASRSNEICFSSFLPVNSVAARIFSPFIATANSLENRFSKSVPSKYCCLKVVKNLKRKVCCCLGLEVNSFYLFGKADFVRKE